MDGIVGTIEGTERYVIDNCEANIVVTTTIDSASGRNCR